MLAKASRSFYNFSSICFSVGFFLAMPCKTASKEKLWHSIIFILTFFTIEVAIILEFVSNQNQNSEGAVVVISAKVTINKNFGIKTRYIRNNNPLPILTLELWRKTKQWYKKCEKYQLYIRRSPRILSHKIWEKCNEREMFYIKSYIKHFAIFTGKHLFWSLFLIKFIKKKLQHRCFLVNISRFFRTCIL